MSCRRNGLRTRVTETKEGLLEFRRLRCRWGERERERESHALRNETGKRGLVVLEEVEETALPWGKKGAGKGMGVLPTESHTGSSILRAFT